MLLLPLLLLLLLPLVLNAATATASASAPSTVAAAATIVAAATDAATAEIPAAAAAAAAATTAATEARLRRPKRGVPVTLAIASFQVSPRVEHARRSNLGLVDVVDRPRRREVERPHEGVSDAPLVRRVVFDERLHVALKLDGVRLQSGPQDAFGAGKVSGSFGVQETVLPFVVVVVVVVVVVGFVVIVIVWWQRAHAGGRKNGKRGTCVLSVCQWRLEGEKG